MSEEPEEYWIPFRGNPAEVAREWAEKYMSPAGCQHDWEHLREDYVYVQGDQVAERLMNVSHPVDIFYCRKCLEYRRVEKVE